MARFTLPSTSILIKVALVIFALGVGAGVGTSSYLVFTEVREINDLITEDRERLARLEAAPTVTPQPTSTAQPTTTPSSEPTPQPTATTSAHGHIHYFATLPRPQPTATPITLPPTATPQPTATPHHPAAHRHSPAHGYAHHLAAHRHSPAYGHPHILTSHGHTYKPASYTHACTFLERPIHSVRRSVVKVETDAGGVGTAWVYEEGWLITAAHVTNGSGPLTVHYRDADGGEISKIVSVVGVDRLRDVAVLAMEGVDLPAITGRREVGVQ